MKKFNYTYQTKNLITGKTYVGVHSTDDINDGYIGCGCYKNAINNKKSNSPLVKSILKHGVDNFITIPLAFFNTREEAFEEEAFIVNDEWVSDKTNYNAKTGGLDGYARGYKMSEATRLKMTKAKTGCKYAAKEITINGTKYNSRVEAARALGIHKSTLYKKYI